MSANTTESDTGNKRAPLLLGAIGLAALVVLILVARAMFDGSPSPPHKASTRTVSAPSPTPTPKDSPKPTIRQAAWQVKVVPAGVGHKLTSSVRKRVEAQRPALSATVENIYNPLFLSSSEAQARVERRFTPEAARRFLGARLGAPPGAERVDTLRRVARIGVDTPGATRAAAQVSVVATGMVKGQRVRFGQNATLWLTRSHGRWKVIAFDARRGPRAPPRHHSKRDRSHKPGHHHHKKKKP